MNSKRPKAWKLVSAVFLLGCGLSPVRAQDQTDRTIAAELRQLYESAAARIGRTRAQWPSRYVGTGKGTDEQSLIFETAELFQSLRKMADDAGRLDAEIRLAAGESIRNSVEVTVSRAFDTLIQIEIAQTKHELQRAAALYAQAAPAEPYSGTRNKLEGAAAGGDKAAAVARADHKAKRRALELAEREKARAAFEAEADRFNLARAQLIVLARSWVRRIDHAGWYDQAKRLRRSVYLALEPRLNQWTDARIREYLETERVFVGGSLVDTRLFNGFLDDRLLLNPVLESQDVTYSFWLRDRCLEPPVGDIALRKPPPKHTFRIDRVERGTGSVAARQAEVVVRLDLLGTRIELLEAEQKSVDAAVAQAQADQTAAQAGIAAFEATRVAFADALKAAKSAVPDGVRELQQALNTVETALAAASSAEVRAPLEARRAKLGQEIQDGLEADAKYQAGLEASRAKLKETEGTPPRREMQALERAVAALESGIPRAQELKKALAEARAAQAMLTKVRDDLKGQADQEQLSDIRSVQAEADGKLVFVWEVDRTRKADFEEVAAALRETETEEARAAEARAQTLRTFVYLSEVSRLELDDVVRTMERGTFKRAGIETADFFYDVFASGWKNGGPAGGLLAAGYKVLEAHLFGQGGGVIFAPFDETDLRAQYEAAYRKALAEGGEVDVPWRDGFRLPGLVPQLSRFTEELAGNPAKGILADKINTYVYGNAVNAAERNLKSFLGEAGARHLVPSQLAARTNALLKANTLLSERAANFPLTLKGLTDFKFLKETAKGAAIGYAKDYIKLLVSAQADAAEALAWDEFLKAEVLSRASFAPMRVALAHHEALQKAVQEWRVAYQALLTGGFDPQQSAYVTVSQSFPGDASLLVRVTGEPGKQASRLTLGGQSVLPISKNLFMLEAKDFKPAKGGTLALAIFFENEPAAASER